MTSSLHIAGPDDIDTVAQIVAASFEHMPVIHYLVPNDSRRLPRSRNWYKLYIAHAIDGAGQVVMTEDASAAAVWFDRTREFVAPADYDERLAELAGSDLPQFQRLDELMDAHHPADPHWHLLFLAVLPDRWSQGRGSELMAHTHARLDATGTAAYLEATSEANRKLYLRHGYTDMDPATIAVADGIDLYRMWRPARNG